MISGKSNFCEKVWLDSTKLKLRYDFSCNIKYFLGKFIVFFLVQRRDPI